MSEQVQISVEGQMGVIALNRPEAINALNLEMIEAIRAALARWAEDGAIKAVLFEGRGSKGFCAGGDVRAVRAAVLSGDSAGAEAFFVSEYGMNGQIATYPKPVAVITQGVVMGGGLGIAGHARYRFTTPEARFAMPEAAIGFFCDVGVNAILSKAPLHRALLFELSGIPVGAADALALGLTDCAVLPDRLAEVRRLVVGAAASSNVDAALAGIMEAESIQAGERTFCDLADQLEGALVGKEVSEIFAAIEESGLATELLTILRSRSPTSQEAILRSHLAARRASSIADVLEMDLKLSRLLTSLPDFSEGVRAVLVDKDHKPAWQLEVPRQQIGNVISL
jgi:enoyl-CoA hydratase